MRLAAAIVTALAASTACAHAPGAAAVAVEGDGRVTTESREVPPFQEILLASSAELAVKVGSGPAVRVTVDGNLQPYVRTHVSRGALVIDVGGDARVRPTEAVRVEVEVPALRRLVIGGSGDVTIDGGAGDLALEIEGSGELRWRGEAAALRASIEGSGEQHLEGKAASLRAEVSGSGEIHAGRLEARDVEASIEGSGDIDVNVSGGKLTAIVEGSGNVTWTGSASIERTRISGSGEVSRRD